MEAHRILKDVKALFPQVSCLVVNLRQLNLDELEGKAPCAVTALRGMVGVWGADDETVALLIEKIRLLEPDDATHLWRRVMEYYDASDSDVVREDFNRVDRERWPDLKEEERLMPTIDFGFERAERQGREQGIEQERLDTANRMLTRGMSEDQILDVLQLTVEQLEKIKRQIKN